MYMMVTLLKNVCIYDEKEGWLLFKFNPNQTGKKLFLAVIQKNEKLNEKLKRNEEIK